MILYCSIGRYIHGIKIISYNSLEKENRKIEQILIAIPSLNTNKRSLLINKLQNLIYLFLRFLHWKI